MKKFKERWNIQSDFQLAIIILVFSLNGSLAVYVAKPLLNFIGLNQETTHPLIFWPLRVLIVFFVYQFTLIIIGTLFGQKEFFWNFSKKMWSRFNFIKS
ncbi:DUF6787 family protein [Namhaeicola litoreus]|uniref:DUF6787 family protein n=1 Tax=Namhaeicola litoreus TaxID=1052145 RepID=A0ABW3Y4L6_9FLAO